MPPEHPTRRPTDASHLDDPEFDPPVSLLNHGGWVNVGGP